MQTYVRSSLVLALIWAMGGIFFHSFAEKERVGEGSVIEAISKGPAVWRVADQDTEIYLFGSIHVLRADTNWFNSDLKNILDQIDVLYLETNTHTRKGQQQMLRAVRRLGHFANRESLRSRLNRKEFLILKSALNELNLKFSDIQSYRPWLAALWLSFIDGEKRGYEDDYGVENVLIDYVGPKTKKRFFASGTKQIKYLANLSEADQINILISMAKRINDEADGEDVYLDALVRSWLDGDVVTLTELSASEARQEHGAYATLLIERNQDWANKLSKVLQEEAGRFFVVAGTAHFLGPDSVQKQLKALGYEIDEL